MINKYLKHKPLQYGKKFYFVEFLAERFIQLVAVLSIGFIIAIFYYIFQEATYAFKTPETHKILMEKSNTNGETTNSSSDTPDENYKSESYNPDAESAGANNQTTDIKPEEYVPETYQSESYSPDSEEAAKSETTNKASENTNETESLEQSYSEQPVTVEKLIMPNDYIENKPEYIWQPISEIPKYSFIPLFVGALKITLIGLIIAAPIAIFAALYTVAFAPRWLKEIIKPAIEILAGFPSVVLGFFCLITLATVVQELFDTTFRLNSFVGGIGMALAVIPIIYTVTEDALTAIPKYMYEGSLALGASRWQTVYRVILPAATPGVFAALILGFGRAFGETMIALMATGNAALVSTDIFESVRTMAATIGAEMAEVEFHSVHYGVLFLIGAVLFVVTFSLNAIAEFYIRKKLMKKFQGN